MTTEHWSKYWTKEDDRLYHEEQDRKAREEAELIHSNRRVVAERTGWPVGALQMCEHLDAVHPGWTVRWRPANTIQGWEHPAGYVAWRDSSGAVCGEDPAALVAAMRRAPDSRHSHFFGKCCDRITID